MQSINSMMDVIGYIGMMWWGGAIGLMVWVAVMLPWKDGDKQRRPERSEDK